jgi:hypothetical protein
MSSARSAQRQRVKSSWLARAWSSAWPRSWAGAGLAAFTAIALLGAGIATFQWAGPFIGQKLQEIGQQRLYSAVNQSQDDSGVTIFVDKAYADLGNVYIAFRVQPDTPMAGSFTPGEFDLVAQSGQLDMEHGGANIQCAARTDSSTAQVCVLDTAPFKPDAGGKTLTLTFDVYKLYHTTSSGGTQTITGSWDFTFTIPFHTRSLGPGGPYAQPN